MAYDIYGERLERGHCEVHPWVHQEYPCSVCYSEDKKYDYEKQMRKQMEKEMTEEYWRDMEREHYLSLPIAVRDPDLATDKRY